MNVNELSAISANMGTITAGSITTNAEINIGTDATIGNILYLNASDSSGQKGIVFNSDGSTVANIEIMFGDMSISVSGFITINPGSPQGVVVNGNLSANNLRVGATNVALSGRSTSSDGSAFRDGGIPIGTQLAISGGGSVSWAGISIPAHSHTQNS